MQEAFTVVQCNMAASQGRLWLLQERLKQERLFVTKEKECIRLLNTEVQSTCEKLFHISWITAQQWRNLQRLQAHPARASYANKLLDNAQFVDAYKTLGYLESKYGDFLKSLRENPGLIASSLAFVDQIKLNIDTKQVARLLLNSLYGNCLLPEDENHVLIVMKYLMEFQILKSEQPHTFFRSPRNWSFTVVFGVLIESLFSAKLYLTAGLHTPILHVLTKDSKIQAQLPFLCTRFVQSLQEKLYCFPPSLRWLICQLFNVLTSSGRLNVNQSKAMVSELLFNYLVCPAIINPEPYGINSNMQVSKIARLNLQQISSLLCKRCTSPWERSSLLITDDMFNTIDVKWISSFVDSILEGAEQISDFPEQQTLPGLCRTSVLITDNELQSLITYLRMIHCWEGDAKFPHIKELGDLLDLLPPEKENPASKADLHSSSAVTSHSPSVSPKVPHKTKKKTHKLRSSKHIIEPPDEDEHRHKSTVAALSFVSPAVSKSQRYQQECIKRLGHLYQEDELVLVIPLSYTCIESPGMLPEEKVLGIEKPKPLSSKKPPIRSHSDSGQPTRPRSNSTRFTKLFHNLSIEQELNKKDLQSSLNELDTSGDNLQTIIGSPCEAPEYHSMPQPNNVGVVPQTTFAANHSGPDLVDFDASGCTNTQVDLLIFDEDNKTTNQTSAAAVFNQTYHTSSILDASLLSNHPPPFSNLPSSTRDSTISSGSSARASTLSSLSSGTRDSTLDNDMEGIDGHNVINWSHDQSNFTRNRESSGSLTVVAMETYRESVVSIDESLPDSTKSDSSSSDDDGMDLREPSETHHRKPAKKSDSIRKKLKKARTLGLEKLKNKKDVSRPKSMPETDIVVKSERKGSGLMKHWRKRDRSYTKQSGTKVYQKIDDSLDLFATPPSIPQSQVEAAVEKTPKDIIEGLISKYQEMATTKALEDTAEVDGGQGESDEEDDEDIDEETRFDDTKRKLRLVLNQADFQNLPWLVSKERVINTSSFPKSPTAELMTFLHVQLAEAINLQNRSLAAQLHETIRSVKQLSQDSCSKLLDSIESDYQARMPYLAYLTRSRQTLLTTESHFDRLIERVQKNQMLCQKCFTTNCITLFLEVREGEINSFITNFRSPDACPTVDEKCKHVDQFLEKLEGDLVKDETWLGATEDQLQDGRIAIERDIMARIYNDAFYPNGQIDMERDKAFTKHVEILQKEVGITHKAIRIPKLYRKEAPWPSAQQELSTINAYKTPKDKLKCVQRCCFTIMNLLNMACTTNSCEPAGADEFVPALVCVLIHANPPSLLSTMQYVGNFYGQRLSGEEAWSWMQLCAAIEYTKTIKA